MDIDLLFQLRVIDYYCTFEYLLGYRTNEYSDLNPSSYTQNNSVYCPFHPNVDTKAAKLYPKDENGVEKLYCFAENKVYYPHSLLSPPKGEDFKSISYRFKSIVPYDPYWVFSAIWNHLPEQDKQYWMAQNPDLSINGSSHSLQPLYVLYRKGELDLFQLLENINHV